MLFHGRQHSFRTSHVVRFVYGMKNKKGTAFSLCSDQIKKKRKEMLIDCRSKILSKTAKWQRPHRESEEGVSYKKKTLRRNRNPSLYIIDIIIIRCRKKPCLEEVVSFKKYIL